MNVHAKISKIEDALRFAGTKIPAHKGRLDEAIEILKELEKDYMQNLSSADE